MCPACGSTGVRPLFTKHGHHYVACTGCGSGRLNPLPSETSELYGADYFQGGTIRGGYADYGADEALHRRNAVDRLNRIEETGCRPPGTVVEMGAGYGFFLDEARRKGWTVAGSDVSTHARDEAGRLGLDLVEDLSHLTTPADVLAAFQVLEHMADPQGELASGVDLLAPGGLLIVETWDRSHWMARRLGRRWQQVAPPSVVHLFNRDGLRAMAQRVGLTDISITGSSKYVSVGAAVGQLAMNRPRLRGGAERVARSTLGRRPIKYGLGDLVTLTARKP